MTAQTTTGMKTAIIGSYPDSMIALEWCFKTFGAPGIQSDSKWMRTYPLIGYGFTFKNTEDYTLFMFTFGEDLVK